MMDASIKNFNELNEKKPFEKFTNFTVGTTFNVKTFFKCKTVYGQSVVVETDEYLFHLPSRYTHLFDTEEKLQAWKEEKNLRITYTDLRGKSVFLTIQQSS